MCFGDYLSLSTLKHEDQMVLYLYCQIKHLIGLEMTGLLNVDFNEKIEPLVWFIIIVGASTKVNKKSKVSVSTEM